MSEFSQIVSIPGLFGEKAARAITFDQRGVTIEKLIGARHKRFLSGLDIAAFRFGLRDIAGLSVKFGREYFIEIKGFNCEVTGIRLISLYGIKNKVYYKLWAEMLQHVWDFFLNSQLSYYNELCTIRQTFDLAGISFHADGISWKGQKTLPWGKIAIKSYQNYFMVHHSEDPRQYKCCVFSIDWNAVVLQSLLSDIIRQNKFVRRTIRRGH